MCATSMSIQTIRNKIQKHFEDKHNEYLTKQRNRSNRRYGKYYQSKGWKDLRALKFTNNPTCEVCERQGYVTPTEEIHHLRPFLTGITEEARWNLLLNYNNLCSCCRYHHSLFHDYIRKNHLDYASIDNILSYESTLNTFE